MCLCLSFELSNKNGEDKACMDWSSQEEDECTAQRQKEKNTFQPTKVFHSPRREHAQLVAIHGHTSCITITGIFFKIKSKGILEFS